MTDRTCPCAPPLALCLGGFDPSAGAGLLRDVMTLAALGVHPMAVPTCDTIQNGAGCLAIAPADPLPRLEALRPHLTGPWGVKLGLCALDGGALTALAARLDDLGPAVRIWDPILAPTSGVGLHAPTDLRLMARTLLPGGGWVVCPNLPEAAALSGLASERDPERLARPLLELGAAAVWLKGGHGEGDTVEDLWLTPGTCRSLGRVPRQAADVRGTGCTLASAWLGLRLQGLDGPEAAIAAAGQLRTQWARAFAPGGFGRPCFAPVGA